MTDIVLRNIEEKDLELLRNWRNSPEISRYMFSDDYISEENQRHWFNKISSDNIGKYWVVDYMNTPIGFASLIPAQRADDTYSFGLYVGNKEITRGGSEVRYFII